jgi:hypothetical protein
MSYFAASAETECSPGQHATHDVAPGPVGERVEQGVRPVLGLLGHDSAGIAGELPT